jgi:hypothetical protein
MLDFNSLVKFYRRRPDLHFGHRFTWSLRLPESKITSNDGDHRTYLPEGDGSSRESNAHFVQGLENCPKRSGYVEMAQAPVFVAMSKSRFMIRVHSPCELS